MLIQTQELVVSNIDEIIFCERLALKEPDAEYQHVECTFLVQAIDAIRESINHEGHTVVTMNNGAQIVVSMPYKALHKAWSMFDDTQNAVDLEALQTNLQ